MVSEPFSPFSGRIIPPKKVAADDAKSASNLLNDNNVVDNEDSDNLSVNGIKLEGVSQSANSEAGEAGGDTGSSHG